MNEALISPALASARPPSDNLQDVKAALETALQSQPISTKKRATKRPANWLFVIAIATAAIAVYQNSFAGVFVLDDIEHIVNSPAIRSVTPLYENLRNAGTRPIVWLSLALNYSYGKLNPTSYHVANLMVHLAAGLTLFGLVRRTLQLPAVPERFHEPAHWLAFTISIIWVVHPLQTQAVTYVIQRSESTMALFFLLCLYGLLRGATANKKTTRGMWYAASWFAFCLGMGSKEVMATSLLVVPLYDRVFLSDSWRIALRQRGWFYAACLVPVVLGGALILPAILSSGNSSVGFGVKSVTAWEYARSQFGVILHYLYLSVWPANLCFDYGWPVARSFSSVALPAIVVVALLIYSIAALFTRSYRPVGFLGLAFFAILSPTSSFIPIVDLAVEHRMYLPLACIVVLLVVAFYNLSLRLPPNTQRWCCGLAAVLVVTSISRATVLRNEVYHSPISLWVDTLQKSPDVHRTALNRFRVFNNLGMALTDANRLADAIPVLTQAVNANPNSAEAQGNLGRALLNQGKDLEQAALHCERAVELAPTSGRYRQQLAILATARGDDRFAETHFQKAMQLSPADPLIQFNYGKFLLKRNKFEDAVRVLSNAAKLEPPIPQLPEQLAYAFAGIGKWDEALVIIMVSLNEHPTDDLFLLGGRILQQQGKLAKAAEMFRAALELNPRMAVGYTLLGDVFVEKNETSAAVKYYHEALRIDSKDAVTHRKMALAVSRHDPARALEHYLLSLKYAPDHAETHNNAANLLARMGRSEAAISHYQEALRLRPDFTGARQNLQLVQKSLAKTHKAATP